MKSRGEVTNSFDMSILQKPIWFQTLLDGESSSQNICSIVRIEGPIDILRVNRAIEKTVETFDAFSMNFEKYGLNGRVSLSASPRIKIEHHDWKKEPKKNVSHALRRCNRESLVPLDLSAAPIARFLVFQLTDEQVILGFIVHHIICDGHSLSLFYARFGDFYNSTKIEIENHNDYRFYLRSEAKDLTGQIELNNAYWENKIAEGPQNQRISNMSSKPDDKKAGDYNETKTIPRLMCSRLDQCAKQLGVTPAAIFLTAHALAIARYSKSSCFSVGVPVSVRSENNAQTFGLFTTIIPIQVNIDWSQPIQNLVKTNAFSLLEGTYHALAETGKTTSNRDNIGMARPYETILVFQSSQVAPPKIPDCRSEIIASEPVNSNFELVTVVHYGKEGGEVHIRDGATRKLSEFTAAIAENLLLLIENIAIKPSVTMSSSSNLPSFDRQQIAKYAIADKPYDFVPIQNIYTTAFSEFSNFKAIEFNGKVHSYQDLRNRSSEISKSLLDKGVVPGNRVAVNIATHPDQIACLIAIWDVGGVFVPISSIDPNERSRRILEETDTQVVILDEACNKSWDDSGFILLDLSNDLEPSCADTIISHSASAKDEAYIIYTSGTTGSPKGVSINHAALSNLIQGEQERFSIKDSSKILLFSPFTFDPWICHVLGAISAGACLYQVQDPKLAVDSISEIISESNITHSFLPATVVEQMAPLSLPSLQVLASAGDHCSLSSVNKWSENRSFFNIYGPTETTVTATVAQLTGENSEVSIGQPIKGYSAHILNETSEYYTPIDVWGELCIGGAGLASHFYGDNQADQKSFIRDPENEQTVLYKTGDIAKLSRSGCLLVNGRLDQQSKIRGFRVNPDEIKFNILQNNSVNDCYVSLQGDGASKKILAYVVGGINETSLRAFLEKRLAGHLIPNHFLFLSSLPITQNGKVDRSSLPKPNSGVSEVFLPACDIEATVARLWAQVLSVDSVASDTNFFNLGGNSLLAVKLTRQLMDLGFAITIEDIYQFPTLSDFCNHCARNNKQSQSSTRLTSQAQISPVQRWFFSLQLEEPDHWNQARSVPLNHIPSNSALENTLAKIVDEFPHLFSRFSQGTQSLEQIPKDFPDKFFSVKPLAKDATTEELRGYLLEANRKINLREPSLFHLTLFSLLDGSSVVYLVIHHLIVDEMSWNIVLDRVRAHLCKNPEETPKYTKVKRFDTLRYNELLSRVSKLGVFEAQKAYWSKLKSTQSSDPLLRAFAANSPRHAQVFSTISLQRLSRALNVSELPLAMCAIAFALNKQRETQNTTFMLERVGRQGIIMKDEANAVGWLAIQHPFLVPIPKTSNLIDHLDQVSNVYQNVPDQGLGYQALVWGENCHNLEIQAAVSLNFILEDSVPHTDEYWSAGLSSAMEAVQQVCVGANNQPPTPLVFVIREGQNGIGLDITCQSSLTELLDVDELLDSSIAYLESIERQTSRSKRDLENTRQPKVKFPANSMQSLMLESTCLHGYKNIYTIQQAIEIKSAALDHDKLIRSINKVLVSSSQFSSVFIRRDDAGWEQIVDYGNKKLLNEFPDAENNSSPDQAAFDWLFRHRQSGFPDLAEGGRAAHFGYFRISEESAIFAIHAHHALADGVSAGLILDQIDDAYSNEHLALPARNYKNHVFAEYLAAARQPDITTRTNQQERWQSGSVIASNRFENRSISLLSDEYSKLSQYAKTLGVDIQSVFLNLIIESESLRQSRSRPRALIVTNGRDGSSNAPLDGIGMYWYFRMLELPSTSGAKATQEIFDSKPTKMDTLRSCAYRDWQQWVNTSACSFNFTETRRQEHSTHLSTRSISSYDQFHCPVNWRISLDRDAKEIEFSVSIRDDCIAVTSWRDLHKSITDQLQILL